MRRRDAISGLILGALVSREASAAARPLAGQPALPDALDRYRPVGLQASDGQPTTLGRLLGRSRAAVVSFWATWCAPCAVEARRLADLRTRYPEARLAIVGVNIDTSADAERLEQFRRKANMNYTQALDGRGLYLAMTASSRLVLPRTFVFDADGRPVAAFGRFFGERTLTAIEAAVREAAG